MSKAAILFRSDAQCVRVNKFVKLSHFIICLPSDLPLPIPSFKIFNIFSLTPCLAAPRPLLLPLPQFLYPLLFSFLLFLYTPIPPYFHPPILFNHPVILIKPQFGTVMGNCTFDKKSEATCAIQYNLVLSVCNTCHVSLSVSLSV